MIRGLLSIVCMAAVLTSSVLALVRIVLREGRW